MTYSLYEKPFQTASELVSYLQEKGLTVSDPIEATNLLKHINYYRFKGYLLPYLDRSTNKYQAGSLFTDGVELYRFDDELRDILFSSIGRVEIKLRTRFDQVISQHSNNPFWYLDDALFPRNKIGQLNSLRSKLSNSFQSSKVEFSSHYKASYFNNTNNDYKQLLPFWLLAELTTFGNIRALYKSIDITKFQIEQNRNSLHLMANEFGARNFGQLNSWLDLINDVRNRCAHHSRVWNCNYREPNGISTQLSPNCAPAHRNRIYLLVAMLHKIDLSLNINICVHQKVHDLFTRYPAANHKKHSAGFPSNWQEDPFWSSVI